MTVETIDTKNAQFMSWDVGGRDLIRPLWRHYYSGTTALIWIVDASDGERIAESAEEVERSLLPVSAYGSRSWEDCSGRMSFFRL